MHAETSTFLRNVAIILGACVSKKSEQLLTCGRMMGVKLHRQSDTTNHICSLGGYENQRSVGVGITFSVCSDVLAFPTLKVFICMCYVIVWALLFLQVYFCFPYQFVKKKKD